MIPIARPIISQEEIDRVVEVLRSGRLVSGAVVREFEEKFARYCGTEHAVTVANGTAALDVALKVCGVKGEVVTTPFSYISSSNCILSAGAKPVFADIDPRTCNIDPDAVIEKITGKTKAVLVVHLYGQTCDMKPIADVCEDKGLILIEDAAQAHGADCYGKKAGSFGTVACFSFYATKNMTTGEGGMIVTNDADISKRANVMVDIGQERKYYHTSLGYNLRMTEMQAAIGIGQLKDLDMMNQTRIKNASVLTKGLSGVDGVTTPFVLPKFKHVFNQYVIQSAKRDELQEHLLDNGIETAVHYPMPITKQPAYVDMGYGKLSLPNSEKAAKQVLSLPVHPMLEGEDLEKIIESVKSFSS